MTLRVQTCYDLQYPDGHVGDEHAYARAQRVDGPRLTAPAAAAPRGERRGRAVGAPGPPAEPRQLRLRLGQPALDAHAHAVAAHDAAHVGEPRRHPGASGAAQRRAAPAAPGAGPAPGQRAAPAPAAAAAADGHGQRGAKQGTWTHLAAAPHERRLGQIA